MDQFNEFEPTLDRNKDGLCFAADTFFESLLTDRSNGNLLMDTIQIPGLSEAIVERMVVLENIGSAWMDDKVLMDLVEGKIEEGILKVPGDPVDKDRWLALLYMSAASKIGFS